MLKVIGIGRLGKDPEFKTAANGKGLCKYSVACPVGKPKDKKVEWLNCVSFNQQADFVAKYLSKGDEVYVEGVLNSSSYENQQGNTVYKTDMIVQKIEAISVKAFSQPNDGGGAQSWDEPQEDWGPMDQGDVLY